MRNEALFLNEFSEQEIYKELDRRRRAREGGVCDYCGGGRASLVCRFPERHAVGVGRRDVTAMEARKRGLKYDGKVVHSCLRSRAVCGFAPGAPWSWPVGHTWSGNRKDWTCPECIERRRPKEEKEEGVADVSRRGVTR